MTTSLLSFVAGAGLFLCLAWVQVARLEARYTMENQDLRARAANLSKALASYRTQAAAKAREAMLQAALEPGPLFLPYVIPPAPQLGASSAPHELEEVPDDGRPVRVAQEYLEQLDREVLRCAAVRREFDRDRCFDPLCDRCTPRSVDTPTAALDRAEVLA